MKSTWKALFGAMLFIAITAIISCQKEGSNTDNTATVTNDEAATISQESAEADADDDDATEIGLSAGADLEVALKTVSEEGVTAAAANIGARLDLFVDLYYKLGPCANITVTPNDTTYPKTVTIDYGTGCLCRDGKFRKGIIKINFTGPARRSGSVITITVDGYYVNKKQVEGTRIITNLSANGAVKYTVEVKDGKITWPNGRGFAYVSFKTVTQISGSDTRTVRDDVYSIEGKVETKYNNGVTVVKSTEEPLIKSLSCEHIVKGKVQIKINNLTFYIDFGNGYCDNKATLINAQLNTEIEIILP